MTNIISSGEDIERKKLVCQFGKAKDIERVIIKDNLPFHET